MTDTPATDDTPAVYSTQPAGARTRILATVIAGGSSHTRSVTTTETSVAADVAAGLSRLSATQTEMLSRWARSHPGQICYLRRQVMAACENGQWVAGGSVGAEWGGPAGPVAEVIRAAAAVGPAERRAVAEEVGRILTGSEDILVAVTLSEEYGAPLVETLANRWADSADDEELLDALEAERDDVLYESLLAWLRSRDRAIDDVCDRGWIDVGIDRVALQAWAGRH